MVTEKGHPSATEFELVPKLIISYFQSCIFPNLIVIDFQNCFFLEIVYHDVLHNSDEGWARPGLGRRPLVVHDLVPIGHTHQNLCTYTLIKFS